MNTKKGTKKKGAKEKQYYIFLGHQISNEEGEKITIKFKREGILGKLGFTYNRPYLLADLIEAVLKHIPAENFTDRVSNIDQEVMADLLKLYTGSIVARGMQGGNNIKHSFTELIGERTVEYLYPIIGGFTGLPITPKLAIFENAFVEAPSTTKTKKK